MVRERLGQKHGPERNYSADGKLAADGVNDATTGRSVAKLYDSRGQLTGEMTLLNRKVVEWRLTMVGLEQTVAQMNEEWKAGKLPATAHVIDERTLGLDFNFPDADPRGNAQKLEGFRMHLLKICSGMFKRTSSQLESVKVRVLNGVDEVPAMATTFTKADCAQQVPE